MKKRRKACARPHDIGIFHFSTGIDHEYNSMFHLSNATGGIRWETPLN